MASKKALLKFEKAAGELFAFFSWKVSSLQVLHDAPASQTGDARYCYGYVLEMANRPRAALLDLHAFSSVWPARESMQNEERLSVPFLSNSHLLQIFMFTTCIVCLDSESIVFVHHSLQDPGTAALRTQRLATPVRSSDPPLSSSIMSAMERCFLWIIFFWESTTISVLHQNKSCVNENIETYYFARLLDFPFLVQIIRTHSGRLEPGRSGRVPPYQGLQVVLPVLLRTGGRG